jgi:hypothetical protein
MGFRWTGNLARLPADGLFISLHDRYCITILGMLPLTHVLVKACVSEMKVLKECEKKKI